MKIDCGPTLYTRLKWQQSWHRWFAWRPVRIGPRACAWLEWVETKRCCFQGDTWDPLQFKAYRALGSTFDTDYWGSRFDPNYTRPGRQENNK